MTLLHKKDALMKKKVVVIGAGLGGLSAAISLATEGCAVSVYEKNDRCGGKLNVNTRAGFTFDLGPSILTMPHVFDELFTRAGKKREAYVGFKELSPHWRNFFEDGAVLDLSPDMRLMEKELSRLAPDASRGFYGFLEYSRRLMRSIEEGYFARGLDTFAELVRFYGPSKSLRSFDLFRSMDGGVRAHISDERLRDVLNYFVKYVGSSPYDAPALLNLLPYVQFGYGLWYVDGGLYALARALEKLAVELGVRFEYSREVTAITTRGDAATGVRLADGAGREADILVSNMEVIPAYERLLNESRGFLRRYRKFEPACSGVALHLGIDHVYPQLAHHNFFYARDARAHFDTLFRRRELSEDPTIYLVAPCVTDPALAPEGCSIIKALPHVPHLRDDRPFTEEDYRPFRERVLDKLERMGLTGLRSHIVAEEMWTPLDIRDRYYSNKGAIYGVVSDRKKNLGLKAPKRSEKYRNLYFVGGSVNPGGGMPMAVMSGQRVRDCILRDELELS